MKVNYKMCKACRRKVYKKYDAWDEFHERMATKGDTITPPYIRCPSPIINDYKAIMVRKVEDYVKCNIPEAYGVSISYPEKAIFLLDEAVPSWCPYKELGWKPEDDMKLISLNGDLVQAYEQRGRTYEFDD